MNWWSFKIYVQLGLGFTGIAVFLLGWTLYRYSQEGWDFTVVFEGLLTAAAFVVALLCWIFGYKEFKG